MQLTDLGTDKVLRRLRFGKRKEGYAAAVKYLVGYVFWGVELCANIGYYDVELLVSWDCVKAFVLRN